MPKLTDKLKGAKLPGKFKGPVWKGPEIDGITQSLLSRFLVCRERFRLLVVHGLKPAERFEPRMEYGNMWHLCEEMVAQGMAWEGALLQYCKDLCTKYRNQQTEVDQWYNVCLTQFPIYMKYWSKQKHVKDREPLLQEQEFRVPYQLPSGRVVLLRGKWDSVDLVNKKFVWLQENKTKSELDIGQLTSQLQFDMQTMIYLVALYKCFDYAANGTDLDTTELADMLPEDAHWDNLVYPENYKIAGVRYNGIRRPLSGGKGSISRHKATQGSKCPKCKGQGVDCPKCLGVGRVNSKPEETKESFYKRLGTIIMEESFDAKGKPLEHSSFFVRFECQVSPEDVARFEQQFLIPILEQLCDWWEYMLACRYDPWHDTCGLSRFTSRHYQTPYGFYNILAEGGRSDLDEYIANGSEIGLQHTNNLFPELA